MGPDIKSYCAKALAYICKIRRFVILYFFSFLIICTYYKFILNLSFNGKQFSHLSCNNGRVNSKRKCTEQDVKLLVSYPAKVVNDHSTYESIYYSSPTFKKATNGLLSKQHRQLRETFRELFVSESNFADKQTLQERWKKYWK